MLLTWIAALCLPCAKTKGMRRNATASVTKRQGAVKSRFATVIVYDVIVAVAMMAWIYTHITDPLLLTYVFWGKSLLWILVLAVVLVEITANGTHDFEDEKDGLQPARKNGTNGKWKEKKQPPKAQRQASKVTPK